MSIGVMMFMSAPRSVLSDPTSPTVRFVLGVGLILASRYGSCTSLHPLTLCMSFTGSPTSDPVCPHIALPVAVMSSDSDSLSCYQFCISWLLPVLVQCPPLHYHWCIAILLVAGQGEIGCFGLIHCFCCHHGDAQCCLLSLQTPLTGWVQASHSLLCRDPELF